MKTGKVKHWHFPLFIVLSVVAIAQLSWWVIFQVGEGGRLKENQQLIWNKQITLVTETLKQSPDLTSGEIKNIVLLPFPDLKLLSNNKIIITEEALTRLDNTAQKRVRMFAFEGSFFGLLVIVGVWAMYWALRRKQEFENQTVELISSAADGIKGPLGSLKEDITELGESELSNDRRIDIVSRVSSNVNKISQSCDRVGMVQLLTVGRREVPLSLTDLSKSTKTIVDSISHTAKTDGFDIEQNIEDSISAITNLDRWTLIVRNMAHIIMLATTSNKLINIIFQRKTDRAQFSILRNGAINVNDYSKIGPDLKLITKLGEIIGGNVIVDFESKDGISISIEIPIWEDNNE